MDGVAAALSELLGGLWVCFVRRPRALCCFLTGWWERGLGESDRASTTGETAAFVSEFECVHEVKGANQWPRSYSLGVTVQHGSAWPRLFERLHNSRVFPH